jgi:hypothetical protein
MTIWMYTLDSHFQTRSWIFDTYTSIWMRKKNQEYLKRSKMSMRYPFVCITSVHILEFFIHVQITRCATFPNFPKIAGGCRRRGGTSSLQRGAGNAASPPPASQQPLGNCAAQDNAHQLIRAGRRLAMCESISVCERARARIM